MTDACNDCGSTTWTASVVTEDGRTCAACWIGLTPLLLAGIPIAPTVGELASKEDA